MTLTWKYNEVKHQHETEFYCNNRSVRAALVDRGNKTWAVYVELYDPVEGNTVFCGLDRTSEIDSERSFDSPRAWAQASVSRILTTFANDIANLASKL